MERIYQFIKKNKLLQMGESLAVGVSGGPDSVLLLKALTDLRAEYALNLHVIHIDHKLRPESTEEACFVRELCERWQAEYHGFAVDVRSIAQKEHLSLEAAGHEARYQIFARVCREQGARKLALGHHADDRAETVLMHLLKGCTLGGLAVMPPQDEWIIRPLLCLRKEEILAICAKEDLPYRLDGTNREAICLRNQVRLELLPYLRENYNPRIEQALEQLAQSACDDEGYLQKISIEAYQTLTQEEDERVSLDLEKFRRLDRAVAGRVLQIAWQRFTGEQKLSFSQIARLMELTAAEKGRKSLCLPLGHRAVKNYQTLVFTKKDIAPVSETAETVLWPPEQKEIVCGEYLLRKEECAGIPDFADDPYTAIVDAEKLDGALQVRHRKNGDKMRPLGGGTKKVKDILIDKKIPLEQRDKLPLVLCGEKIVWLATVALSDDFKVTEQTKKCIKIYCREKK